ncbi:MAG: M14 family metallopeptidase, partial [Candidatus Thermoplasmatota archaeon]
ETNLENNQVNRTVTILSESVVAYRYYTYDHLVAELKYIETQYGNIVKLHDIGDSVEGRDIWAIKISDNPLLEENDEPDILYVSGEHGNEWLPIQVLMYFLNNLTKDYGTDPNITYIVNNKEIWIVPMANPDGVEYSQQVYGKWRKNRRPVDLNGNWVTDVYGVDLNRNYGYKWGENGSNEDPFSEKYRGPKPFSEPEVRAIRDLVFTHDFIASLSCHCYGKKILYPWGYTRELAPDAKRLKTIAEAMAPKEWLEGPYPVVVQCSNLSDDGQNAGNSIDYLYGTFNIFSFGIEIGDGFLAEGADKKIGETCQEVLPTCLYLANISRPKAPTELKISISGNNV